MIGMEPMIVKKGLDESQLSLTVNTQLANTILDLKTSYPDLKLYIMSNISRVSYIGFRKGLSLMIIRSISRSRRDWTFPGLCSRGALRRALKACANLIYASSITSFMKSGSLQTRLL
jgi:hypothetical protein